MHEDFVATVFPQVHETLKLTPEEQVHMENPPSSSGTLSSMKDLDDAFTFATTTTTTTLLPPPHPQKQSTTVHELATYVSKLDNICANFEKKHKLQDKTTQALSSRVFTLENHDLYSKIDNYVNETVKEAVQNALQALVRERFREFSEFEMKEILHDRMFESGSYRSNPEHAALYDALEVSMDRENREEFIEATTKPCMRRRDDQDPPPPPPKDSDQNKKKRHDSDALASIQPPTAPQSEQPVNDVPIPDDVHISDSEDTGAAHLPKIKTRPDWLKHVPEEEMPKTPEPEWVIPPNDLPETENNWANALTKPIMIQRKTSYFGKLKI
ncbi:hypothetical protein Tco_1515066 [Tanacetum coccineum]